jgi:hypothetical protein
VRLLRLVITVVALSGGGLLWSGCGSGGRVIYPHPPGEPGTDPGPEITGVSCGDPSTSCVEVRPGSGDALKAFGLVTVRVTVDDVSDPSRRVGPRQVAFLHPPLGPIPFRGRDRDLTTDMLRDPTASRIGGRGFFERDAETLVGVWVIGMRRGSARRVHGRYAGRLDGIELPAGRDRLFLIELVDFCYPTVRVSGRMRWSWLDGSGSPVNLQPTLSVSGCESGS